MLAAVSTAQAGPAAAASLACGTTVTANTTLTADIGSCPGDGLIIGADNITVDLGGHTVRGTGVNNRTGIHGDQVGIHLTGRSGVTVTGGTVSGFAAGVAIEGGSHNTVSKMILRGNIGSTDILASPDFGDGVFILNSADNLVTHNEIRHNGPFEGIGVFGSGVPTRCEKPDTGLQPDVTLAEECQAAGIGGPPNPAQGNRIVGNIVANNDVPRVVFATTGPAELAGRTLNEDEGINLGAGLAGSSHNLVANNSVTGNAYFGIVACSIKGNPCFTDFNVIRDNDVSHNGFGNFSDPNTFNNNEIGGGIKDQSFIDFVPSTGGHYSLSFPDHDVISGNIMHGNAGNGLSVIGPGHKIFNNIVTGNGVAGARTGSNGFSSDDYDFFLTGSKGIFSCDQGNIIQGNTFGTVSVPQNCIPVLIAMGNRILNPGFGTSPGPALTAPQATLGGDPQVAVSPVPRSRRP